MVDDIERCGYCFSALQATVGGFSCPVMSCIAYHRPIEIEKSPMPLRVFILEDEIYREPRNQILEILRRHRVTIATSVVGAKYNFGKDSPYDLLLLDHDMRGFPEESHVPHSGYQFCRWLTDNYEKPDLDVFLHSQNHRGRAVQRALFNAHGWRVHEHSFGPAYLEFLETFVKGK
jgi:CheY-like chemotaxis protein